MRDYLKTVFSRIVRGRPRHMLDLGQAASLVGLPTNIHFQRRADQWRLAKRASTIESGVMPLASSAGDLYFFDSLRSELNMQGGMALSNLHLARSLARDYPDVELKLSNDQASLEFAEVYRSVRSQCSSLRVHHPHPLRRWLTSLRYRAYVVKTRLQRRLTADQSNGQVERAAIVAIPRMPGHVADMLPVVRILRDEHGIGAAFGVLSNALMESVAAAAFAACPLHCGDSAELRVARAAARQTLRQIGAVLDAQQPELPLDVLENFVLARRARRVLDDYVPHVLDADFGVARLIERFRPRLLLLGNPYTLEGRAATYIARKHGIATAVIEHGSIFPNDPIWQEIMVDTVCVWGEPSRRALLTCGVPDERIVVTGAPRHDEVFREVAEDRFRRDDAPFVLVAASGPGDMVNFIRYQAYIRLLYEAAELAREVQWVVKLHKKDSEEYYRQVCPDGNPRVKIVRGHSTRDGVDIFDYLRPARALVTISSTSAMDAMAVDVPVITVDVWPPGKGLQGIEFLERGCTTRVRTARELADAVLRAWRRERDEPRERAARQYAAEHFANRGCAARAVADRLLATIQEAVHVA